MKHWKFWDQPLCPRCLEPEDHRFHVFCCMHSKVATFWDRWLECLAVWLVAKTIHPDLCQGLLSILCTWKDDIPWQPHPSDYPNVIHLYECQRQAGLNAVIDGFLHLEWAAVQHNYYIWLHCCTIGFGWLLQVIRRLWEVAWDLWQHRNRVLRSDNSYVLVHPTTC